MLRPLTPEEAEEDDLIERLEAKMQRRTPCTRCPLCRRRAVVAETQHPYGEGYVTEFHNIDCELCDVVLDCRECYRYYLYDPERHPCPELLSTTSMCKCPWDRRSPGTRDPVPSLDDLESFTDLACTPSTSG